LGDVHLRRDEQFELLRSSTVLGLESPWYDAVRSRLEQGYAALDAAEPDGVQAIRGVFGSAESLFTQMFPKAPRLAGNQIRSHLEPELNRRYSDHPNAQRASLKMMASLTDWVDAAHVYRHEGGRAEPSVPPLELTLLMVSQALRLSDGSQPLIATQASWEAGDVASGLFDAPAAFPYQRPRFSPWPLRARPRRSRAAPSSHPATASRCGRPAGSPRSSPR
jgi:hypothetical protein